MAGARGIAALGGPQRRLILALLMVHREAGCTADTIADALWPDAVPEAANTVLHAQISRLRRILEPERAPRAPARVLRSTHTGYRLDLTGHTCDADTFVALLDQGRKVLAAEDPETARDLLDRALALWRGPAYADFAGHPVFVAAAAELDEKRNEGRELRTEARLLLGEHAEVAGEQEALVRDHPFRERMWCQLMLALYRCGRQAEALAAYQRCRTRLVEELGIEPGPELQQLNEAVLLQDADLEWRPPGPSRAAAALASTGRVPVSRTSFVGREMELAETLDALKAQRLVTLTGTAGVGKTRLAGEVANRVSGAFHHGVSFCDLKTVPGVDQLPSAVTAAVGLRNQGSSTGSLTDHLAGREQLLIVDNADRMVDAVAELADEVLSACPRVRMLVTSREPLRATGEQLIALSPLATAAADDDACALFLDRARLSAPRADLDHDAVMAVCRRLGGLPLAIELAASRLRSIPLDQLLLGLDDHLSAIATTPLPTGAGGHATLREVVDWSVELLDDPQRSLLRRMAVFAKGCTSATAARVCDLDTEPVEALAELVDRSLVEMESSGDSTRYRLLEAIRADGLARLAEQGELEELRRRHLDWCLSLAPDELDHGEDPDALGEVGAEIDDVVAALAWSLAGPDVSAGALLAMAAAPVWVNAGRLDEARTWLDRAVAATDTASPEHRAATRWLGWALGRQGRFGEAREQLATAADLARRDGDRQAELDAELLLGGMEIEAGDLAAGEARCARTSTPRGPRIIAGWPIDAMHSGSAPNRRGSWTRRSSCWKRRLARPARLVCGTPWCDH